MRDLAVGQRGVLVGGTYDAVAEFKVISVVDGSNLVAAYDDSTFHGATASTPEAARAASYTTHHYVYFWLTGFSTKGVVDDDKVIIPWVVNVTDTKKYNGNTILLIEPCVKTKKEQQAEAAAAQREQQENQSRAKAELERKAAAERARWRVWTDASRTHKLEARFKWMLGDKVKLVKRDGTELSIALEKLSEDDQRWIQDRTKKKQ
jgi:hypothetical protein